MTQHFLLSLTWIPALLLLQATTLAGTLLSADRSSCSHMRNICFPLYSPVCSTLHSEVKIQWSAVKHCTRKRSQNELWFLFQAPLLTLFAGKKSTTHEVLHIQVRGMQGSGAECQQFSSHETSLRKIKVKTTRMFLTSTSISYSKMITGHKCALFH